MRIYPVTFCDMINQKGDSISIINKMIYSRPDTIISETKIPCIFVDSSLSNTNQVPPACGGIGGQVVRSKMINQLQLGDHIIDLYKNFVLVKDTRFDRYKGSAIEIKLEKPKHILYALPENLILCQRKVTKLSPTGRWGDVPQHHFQKARQLRKQATPPEQKLWQYLRSEQLGVKFRSQHPINRYVVDFYARKAGLVVEVDGELAHTTPDQLEHDRERDKFIEGLGLKVVRFSALDVMSNIEGVVSEIEYHLQESVPDNYTSGQWRYANNIEIGDKAYFGENLILCQVCAIREIKLVCDVTILRLEKCDSFRSNGFVFRI